MNKSQLKSECKRILNELPENEPIFREHPLFSFLYSVFMEHPEIETKAVSGVEGIMVKRVKPYNTKCFHLLRCDGTVTDISYIQAINGPSSKLSNVKCACRSSIYPIIKEFRSSLKFPITCPITLAEIDSIKDVHIDHHDQTFDSLVLEWLSGHDLNQIELNDGRVDNETVIRFLDKSLEESFIKYHNANTHLRAVSIKANLSVLRTKL
jgi:hypothetical protein